MAIFYDRTNDAGSGTRYDRTNNAEFGFATATADIGSVSTGVINATVLGFRTVTLVDPIYTGPGSIAYSSNFTGTPVAGDTVRYPTTNNFEVLADGSVVCDVNSGAYVCYYNDGGGEDTFTVNLSGTAQVYAEAGTVTTVAPLSTAVGYTAGNASALVGTVTTVTVDGVATTPIEAFADVGSVSATAPNATASSSAFPGTASGQLGLVTVTAPDGSATGAALGLGEIAATTAVQIDAIANEFGRADAAGAVGTAIATTVNGRGRAQWGKIQAVDTIWTKVSAHP